LILAACSSGTDNSEPPAELTSIPEAIPLVVNWALDTRASANSASYRLRPLLVGNRVYTIDTRGSVVCVDLERRRRQWRFETGIAAITGLGGDANLIVGASRNGEIAAFHELEDGLEPVWKVDIGSEIRATPIVDGDRVFVRSVDGKLRSLDASDGRQLWVVTRRVPALSLTGNSEPLVLGEMVVVGHDDGKLVAFDRSNGEIRWETSIGIPSGRT
jgi:outer membrane protein assembly factor BamB